jgi:tetratricopeptide (TPR) repeat protein
MRTLSRSLVLAFALIATPALADYGSKPSLPAPARGTGEVPTATDATQTPRQQAEWYYRDAYEGVMKGSKDLASGNAKAAQKRFRRALERSREAVGLDSTYAEAWNLVGFTSRKLGDYPRSFEAYRVALRQKPDFALAHEYLGEGLLETGDLAGARVHLEALHRIGDAALAAELQGAIDRYMAAHPDSTASGAAAK